MDLDGARNAKAEIFDRAFGYRMVNEAFDASSGVTTPLFIPEHRDDEKADAGLKAADESLIAMGISPTRPSNEENGHKIVLLCQRQKLKDHPLIERAIRIAKGEVRVVFTGAFERRSAWTPPRRRPLLIGTSIGHYRVTAGTLGAFVDLGANGGVCILSNNHVLANVNRGQAGDPILQPGRLDTGVRPADLVGFLHRFSPIQFSPGSVNFVDCATATLVDRLACNFNALHDAATGAHVATLSGRTGEPFPEIEYLKVGRTTGLTHGQLFAAEVDNLTVNMGTSQKPMLARFDNQLQFYSPTQQFSMGGDSGSLIVDAAGTAYGLLFAGSLRGAPGGFGLTSANPMDAVLAELGATLRV